MLVASAAIADGSTNYLLGSGGVRAELTETGSNYLLERRGGLVAGLSQQDDSDFGWKLLADFQFSRQFGAEVGYTEMADTGQVFARGQPGAAFQTEPENIEFSGAVTGIYPLSRAFGLYGTVGATRWGIDGRSTTLVGGTSVSVGAGSAGTDLLLGFGGHYNLDDQTLFRFEWQHYNDLGIDASRDTDANVFGGSFEYRF